MLDHIFISSDKYELYILSNGAIIISAGNEPIYIRYNTGDECWFKKAKIDKAGSQYNFDNRHYAVVGYKTYDGLSWGDHTHPTLTFAK